MASLSAIVKKLRERGDIPPERGTREILCQWLREGDAETAHSPDPIIELHGYTKLLELLPDKIVTNLEKARLARDGKIPMLKAGLGFEELLSSVIQDGTAITSSSTEAFLFPALVFTKNYFAPNGAPTRTIHWKARGRLTTLTTAATLTFKFGAAATNVIPTTTWAVSGAITMDTTAQTASQWYSEGAAVVRSVGSGGTVFCQGDCMVAAQALTIANQHADFMGSAGQDSPSTAALDTTADQYVSLTAKWSLSTAYSIQGHIFMVECLN